MADIDSQIVDEYQNTRIEEAKNCSNKKFYPLVLLLMHTGMRTGEAARLHKKLVDLEKRSVLIIQTKSKKKRSVPLTKDVAEALASIEPDEGYHFLKPNHLKSKRIMLCPGSIF